MKTIVEIICRIGIFGTFIGHGIVAYLVNPKWYPLLTCHGFSIDQSSILMHYIGIIDIIVAVTILIYPLRLIVLWATIWAFLAAFSRPISGELFIEFVERSANWCLPLALFFTLGIPNNYKD